MRLRLGVLALVTLAPTLTRATTIRVPADQPTIADGVAASSDGDTVLVACGAYAEGSIQVPAGITLRSETGQSDCVTVDGGLVESYLLNFTSTGSATLEGFTLTGAATIGAVLLQGLASATVRNCWFRDNQGDLGGGLTTWAGTSVVDDCVFSNNAAIRDGGALAHLAGTMTVSNSRFVTNSGARGGAVYSTRDASFADCTFTGNIALIGRGGAVHSPGAGLTVMRSVFADNQSNAAGGGIYVAPTVTPGMITECIFRRNDSLAGGGAIEIRGTRRVTVADCQFDDNSSSRVGGAIRMRGTFFNPEVLRCRFFSNAADSGGAIAVLTSSVIVDGSVFFRNRADAAGGALYVRGGIGNATACTFAENGAGEEGGGVFLGVNSSLALNESIVAFSTDGEAVSGVSPVVARCTDVYGNAGGDWVGPIAGQETQNSNLFADPRFCDLPAGNVQLMTISPCAPANSPCGLQVGAKPVACGPVSVEQETWARIKSRYRR